MNTLESQIVRMQKKMWDTLQVTHEGTTDVKRSRINTLTHEYELFRMNQNETIQDMQKRFTHTINHAQELMLA